MSSSPNPHGATNARPSSIQPAPETTVDSASARASTPPGLGCRAVRLAVRLGESLAPLVHDGRAFRASLGHEGLDICLHGVTGRAARSRTRSRSARADRPQSRARALHRARRSRRTRCASRGRRAARRTRARRSASRDAVDTNRSIPSASATVRVSAAAAATSRPGTGVERAYPTRSNMTRSIPSSSSTGRDPGRSRRHTGAPWWAITGTPSARPQRATPIARPSDARTSVSPRGSGKTVIAAACKPAWTSRSISIPAPRGTMVIGSTPASASSAAARRTIGATAGSRQIALVQDVREGERRDSNPRPPGPQPALERSGASSRSRRGGWAVPRDGTRRADSFHDTQPPAVERATDVTRRPRGELRVKVRVR